ncbi:glycine betaine ABC transporter substrate-binding protein [Natranaerobius thermophilus]|uniref:Substrate-binding region of ABC-type glycine betaine transport system n=1 Tax=Natranaerobius thermophilus (strain ATCC BAA-1301 / DSM 18059 / JW/NM-WN-LF) TaxID=457570 RepID=B2A771_NATTJ|nr:glycine betaine ABC transporter substrate-binding protein [Natranaerobius thermophilus]ACB84265.1 Substrate-binding region of ABC-type glycine betaine transport system [Natranaerobius thermophilus JW/NM-WN-LF]
MLRIISNNKIILFMIVIITTGGLMAACGDEAIPEESTKVEEQEQNPDNEKSEEQSEDEQQTTQTIEIAYVNWADCVATTYLAKEILEEEMGYEVELTMADPGPIYTDIAEGEHDVFLGGWLPITHEEYWEEYQDKVDKISPNFEGARIGLVVPDYVDIDSIEDMNDVTDKFDGEIIGIDPGAGIMQTTETALEEYGLNFNLIEGSDPAMATALQESIEEEEWVVVTGWIPHWKFATWDLEFLEDPKKVYGEQENIYNIGRSDLEQDLPEVREFLEEFQLSQQGLGELMADINETEDEEESAKRWIEDNSDKVEDWTP